MEKQIFQINESFVVNALRNCGYSLYTAIADIIDNSLEVSVESKNVWLDFETKKEKSNPRIISFLIADDGNGMPMEVLKEALSLGSNTGKNPELDLGCYGAGLKTAGISIGQKLEVFTKTSDAEVINYALLSIESFFNDSENPEIELYFGTIESSDARYAWFTDFIKGSKGTIVKISELNEETQTSLISVSDTLKKKMGKIFNKFIVSGTVKIFVRGTEMKANKPIPDYSELLGSGIITINDKEISYNAWKVPFTNDKDGNEQKDDFEDTGTNRQGFYVYRQSRLVGESLSLGAWERHPDTRRFRVELFVDGTCDKLFGSNFTKLVNDTTAKEKISQSLLDKIRTEIGPYRKRVMDETKMEVKRRKEEISPDEIKKMENFYDNVKKKQNANKLLDVVRRGINKKREEEEKEHNTRGKQKNPNPVKIRKDVWLGGFIEDTQMSPYDSMFECMQDNGKTIVRINKNHQCYSVFYALLPDELKFRMAQILSCYEIAKKKVRYYEDDELAKMIDELLGMWSEESRKSLVM